MLHVKDIRLAKSETVFLTVAHHTYGWIQDCFESLDKHCPEIKKIVVDNNPSSSDPPKTAKSFLARTWNKTRYEDRIPMCDMERDWIENESGTAVILRTEHCMEHGKAIDMANDWLKENSEVKYVFHIEPDCKAFGRVWFESMMQAVKAGFWYVSGDVYESKVLRPVPSLYELDKAMSFKTIKVGDDKKEDQFSRMVKKRQLRSWQIHSWDTGHKFFYEAAKQGKAAYIPCPDFKHFGMGSRRIKHPAQLQYLEELDQ